MTSERSAHERQPGRSPHDLGQAATSPASVSGPRGSDPRHAQDLDYAIVRGRAYAALFEEPTPQKQLGRYVLLGTLGRGGMGTVLEAFDRTLDRRVAVKVLHRELGERQRQRLVREAQALAKLSHPHVVQVYDVGEADGQVFIAMELVRGRSLQAFQQQEPRPGWRELVAAYVQAGEGLAAAHAEGLVHRDFKPGNAIIDDKGRVRVLDFGLARQAEDTEPSQRASLDGDDDELEPGALATPLTRTGAVLGTPAYMPLEQLQGQQADARSDQFSFCVSLHEALYGERPFEGRSLEALAMALQSGKVRPAPKGSPVPEALRRLVLRGLSTDPAARWPSMEALLVELRRQVAPRRRARWVLGLGGGLAVVGLGLWQYAAVGFRCDGARGQLEGVWDAAREQAVEQAILGTGLPYAPDTWERVRSRLGEYADAWADKHTEVCEATSVRQEQSPEVMDLRMECLRARRLALREAVDVLAGADATRVRHAVELVDRLPGLASCDEVEALRAELPPPEDPQVAARVEALREQLAEARALGEAGAYDEATARVQAVVEQAEPLGYAPLLAEALLSRGQRRRGAGQYAEAVADAERAYLVAVEHRHEQVEVDAAIELSWVVSRKGRYEAGHQWGNAALALARRRPFEPELEAATLSNLGVLLRLEGRLPEALEHQRRALAIRERAFGPRALSVARSLGNLGGLLREMGRHEEALDALRRALAIDERELGPGHPQVGKTYLNLGAVFWAQGKHDESLRHLRRALAIWEAAFGPDHPDVAQALNNLGVALVEQGKVDEALDHMRRAHAITERVLGPDHPDVATGLSNIGVVLQEHGKLDEALDHYRRALAIRERALEPSHPDVAQALNNLGAVLHARGQLDEARRYDERALAIFEQALGPSHPDLVNPLVGLTEIALAQQAFGAAREHAERAVSIGETSEAAPALLPKARFLLAQALWADAKERPRARAVAEKARDAYAAAGDGGNDRRAAVEAWLAAHSVP